MHVIHVMVFKKPNIMKNLCILLLICGMGHTAVSQNFYFGIKGGLNLTTLSGDTAGLDSRTAIHFGLMSEFIITEKFSVQPELLYSGQGARADGESLKLDYLILPIMGKYYIADGLSLEVGPQFGLLLSAKTEFDGEDDLDIKDEFRDFDFGVNFGLGYKLQNGLNFGLRYNLGISNAYFDDFFQDMKVHNSVFQISLGYLF